MPPQSSILLESYANYWNNIPSEPFEKRLLQGGPANEDWESSLEPQSSFRFVIYSFNCVGILQGERNYNQTLNILESEI